jgi:integrase
MARVAYTAAYCGLRWGELVALTVGQVDVAARVITVNQKVVEVAGHLYAEAPKNRKHRKHRKHRKTIYPPPDAGWVPAGRAARRPSRRGPR